MDSSSLLQLDARLLDLLHRFRVLCPSGFGYQFGLCRRSARVPWWPGHNRHGFQRFLSVLKDDVRLPTLQVGRLHAWGTRRPLRAGYLSPEEFPPCTLGLRRPHEQGPLRWVHCPRPLW